MEPKGSLPCSEQPTSCPSCVQHESNYCTPFLFLWALFRYFLSTASGVCLLDFPTKMLLFFPMCTIWPPNSPLHYLSNQIIFGEEHRLWNFSLCSLLQSPVPLSLLGSDIFSTMLSNTLSVCFSLSVKNEVLSQHTVAGKIIFLFILFLYSYTINGKIKHFELNGNRNFVNLICSISSWVQFDFLVLLASISTWLHWWRFCWPFVCFNFDLHSVHNVMISCGSK
jgi:hypothetical protein